LVGPALANLHVLGAVGHDDAREEVAAGLATGDYEDRAALGVAALASSRPVYDTSRSSSGAIGFLPEPAIEVRLTALVKQPMRCIVVDRDELRPRLFEGGPAGGSAVVDLVARREAVQQHDGGGRQRVDGERA